MSAHNDWRTHESPEVLASLATAFEQLGVAVADEEQAIDHVLRTLARVAGGEAAILAPDGSVIARAPADSEWAGTGRRSGAHTQGAVLLLNATEAGRLVIRGTDAHPAMATFAATLLSGALARRMATLSDRRHLADQVLHDVLHTALPDDIVGRRLASFGITFDAPNRVLIGRLKNGADVLPDRIDALFAPASQPLLRGVVDDEVAVVVSSRVADEAAIALHEELARYGGVATIGVGGEHRAPVGLRVSYAEARVAAYGDPGIRQGEPLFLAGLIRLLEPEAVIAELARAALAPLVAHDAQTRSHTNPENGGLVSTLESFLASDCSYVQTAERLQVHPNTVRYRVRQIEAVTGHDLSSFRARAHFWLAIAAARRSVWTPD